VSDIWIVDQRTNAARVLFKGPGLSTSPVWSPDSKRLVYGRANGSGPKLYLRGDTSGAPEEALPPDFFQIPGGWSADDRYIVYSNTGFAQIENELQGDIFLIDLHHRQKPIPLIATPFHEANPTFSRTADGSRSPRLSPAGRNSTCKPSVLGMPRVSRASGFWFHEPARRACAGVAMGKSSTLWVPTGRSTLRPSGYPSNPRLACRHPCSASASKPAVRSMPCSASTSRQPASGSWCPWWRPRPSRISSSSKTGIGDPAPLTEHTHPRGVYRWCENRGSFCCAVWLWPSNLRLKPPWRSSTPGCGPAIRDSPGPRLSPSPASAFSLWVLNLTSGPFSPRRRESWMRMAACSRPASSIRTSTCWSTNAQDRFPQSSSDTTVAGTESPNSFEAVRLRSRKARGSSARTGRLRPGRDLRHHDNGWTKSHPTIPFGSPPPTANRGSPIPPPCGWRESTNRLGMPPQSSPAADVAGRGSHHRQHSRA